jgi:hypothetical protein
VFGFVVYDILNHSKEKGWFEFENQYEHTCPSLVATSEEDEGREGTGREGTLSKPAETVRASRGHREGEEDVESGKGSAGQKASELTPLLTAQKGQQ